MLPKPYTFFLARRYLAPSRRNRFVSFITAIAVLGVMFGTTALLISLSILDGFETTLRSTMIAFTGHIRVESFGDRPLVGFRDVVRTLPTRVPEVAGVSPFAAREVIVRSRSGLEGVQLKGVIPGVDVSRIGRYRTAGTMSLASAPGALPTIVIGERLAHRLRVGLSDTLVVFAHNGPPSPDNPPVIEQFVIAGMFRTGMAEYDDLFTYTSLSAAQSLFGLTTDEVTGYDVAVRDIRRAEATARVLDTALGFPHYPRTVFEIFSSVFAWLDLQREPIPIVLALISVVAAFNIVATLLMVVLEKTESIGVLSTLGARPGGIMAIFVGQGLMIGGIGTALGVALSLLFTWLQTQYKLIGLDADIYFVDAVPVSLVAWHYLLVVVVSLSLSVLSTIAPAWVASRLRPVDALRFR